MSQPLRFVRSPVLRPQPASRALFRILPGIAMGAMLATATLTQAGCKLIDQRTFDPDANRKPVPTVPPSIPVKQVPPLATVRFGAPPETWQPDLAAIVREALARKPDALFTVQTVVPVTGSAEQQASAMEKAVRDGGQPVAQVIQSAGASTAQINMTATTDTVSAAEIRVTVR